MAEPDLAAMVAQAAKQRIATQALQAETAALLEELRQQCDRVSELHRVVRARDPRGLTVAVLRELP